jgi:hypothetical protein
MFKPDMSIVISENWKQVISYHFKKYILKYFKTLIPIIEKLITWSQFHTVATVSPHRVDSFKEDAWIAWVFTGSQEMMAIVNRK